MNTLLGDIYVLFLIVERQPGIGSIIAWKRRKLCWISSSFLFTQKMLAPLKTHIFAMDCRINFLDIYVQPSSDDA